MNTKRSTDELMNEFNEKAKAEGCYEERAFWQVPAQPGSLLDGLESPESLLRIAQLLAQIAELRLQEQATAAPLDRTKNLGS